MQQYFIESGEIFPAMQHRPYVSGICAIVQPNQILFNSDISF